MKVAARGQMYEALRAYEVVGSPMALRPLAIVEDKDNYIGVEVDANQDQSVRRSRKPYLRDGQDMRQSKIGAKLGETEAIEGEEPHHCSLGVAL